MSIHTRAHVATHTKYIPMHALTHTHTHTQRVEIFVVLMVKQWRDNKQYVVRRRDSEPGGAVRNHCRTFMRLLIEANFTFFLRSPDNINTDSRVNLGSVSYSLIFFLSANY